MLILASLALAEDTAVLVSAMEARNDESVGLAALVEGFLAQELARNAGIRVVRVEDTPDFDDYPARTYMDGCPKGEIVGCTLVVGQRGEAAYAVTGSVQALVEGTRVTIEIIDIEGTRTVLSFQSELSAGNDSAFAEGVARVLGAAIAGELDETDIRDEAEDDGARKLDAAAVAHQLEALSHELGEVTAVVTRLNRLVARPAYTVEDLAKGMRKEGGQDWERLGMTANEYLRYKNSGLSLVEWRERSVGRAGQLLLRPYGTFARGPWNGEYYGRYAFDDTLVVVDAYSTQAVTSASGGGGGLDVAFGILPVVDVGASIAAFGGTYAIDIGQQTGDEPVGYRPPEVTPTSTLLLSPHVTVAPLPTRRIRPVVGGGLAFAFTSGVQDKMNLPAELKSWPAPLLVMAEAFVGGEASISERVDFFARVPFDFVVGGALSQTSRVAQQEVFTDLYTPEQASPIGIGIQVGLQVRLFGRAPRETSYGEDGEDGEGGEGGEEPEE